MSENYESVKLAFQKATLYDELIQHDFKKILSCSFCGNDQNQIEKLIAGAGIYICNECVELCTEILGEEDVI